MSPAPPDIIRLDIIRLAREADTGSERFSFPIKFLERFATLVIADFLERTGQYVTNDASRETAIAVAVADERKECISAIEELMPDADRADCADAIRARGTP